MAPNGHIAQNAVAQWSNSSKIVSSAGDVGTSGIVDVTFGCQTIHVEAREAVSGSKSFAWNAAVSFRTISGSTMKKVNGGGSGVWENGFALYVLGHFPSGGKMCKNTPWR